MSDWTVWGISRWNERLLAHFFSRRSDNDGPVTTLLATQEEIARATGDTAASPDAVHDTFIATTLRTVRNGSLLDTAADYLGYPAPPLDDQIPPFVWCLIFTCIAAAESSEDLASEGSFVARLRRLTNDRLPDPSLQILPRLWENLATWLANPTNTSRYRRLRLPDRGGLTRIGYTTKLAFPDRRDQRELSELLDTEGLLGHEPPIGKVVSLVARERTRFRRPFLDAMDEFRRQLTDAETSGASRLLEHRFWSAVREAAVRGRGRDEELELRCRVQLLAELQDDQLSLIAVSDEAMPEDDVLASIELPVSYGPWRYAVVDRSDAGSLDGAAFERIVLSLLTLAQRIAPLSGYIEQGILPFLETNHGLLELAPMNAIGAAQIALVKQELRDDLVRLFGTATTRIAASRYQGWVQIEYPNFASVASEQLEPTSLRRAWMLHRSVARLAVTLSGGIATDDGWLGLREVLPTVQAPGAISVTAHTGDDAAPLLRASDGWSFPRRDFVGSYELEVTTSDDDMVGRTVHFSLYPTHEEYKEAADPTAWIVEGVGSTSATTRTIPFLAGEPADDARGFADSTIYLGRGLGEFVHDATTAAWSISDFGSVRVGRRGRPELAAVPTVQSANPKSRRYWRKLLLQSAADPNDAQFRDARHLVRQHVQRGGLPDVEFEAFEETEHIRAAEPHRSLDRLVGAVAARANSRCGMSWWEWSLLVQQLLGLDPHHVGPVTRAWQEVAAIDVLSASRWRHRCVFARRPCLVSYRCGLQIGATLVGLTLASTRSRLVEVVGRAGFALEERGSVSPFVPKTVALRVDRMKQLEEVARATGIRVSTVDLAVDGFRSACTHDPTSPAPVAYHWSKRWPTWSLTEPETPPGPEVVHWLRDDRPGYWRVSHNDRTVWSYDLNVARWWAARLAGRDAIKTVGAHQLEAHHAYLPLPIARVMSVFARTNHGPEPVQSWRYRYPLVTTQLRDEVLAALLAAFDLQHLQGA